MILPATIKTHIALVKSALRRFHRADAGIAAIEFAFLLPVLLIVYVYLVEFSRAFDEKRKIDRLATTITDLISQQPTSNPIASLTVSSILSTSASLVTPFSASGLRVTASVVELTTRSDSTCCDARVKWTFTQGGTMRPCSVVLQQVAANVPPQLNNILDASVGSALPGIGSSGEIVVADVQAGFTPIFGGVMKLFSSGFQRTVYMVPRSTGQLLLQSPASPQPGQQAQICS